MSTASGRRLIAHVPPLTFARGSRWPLLIWGDGPVAGPELQAWIERGMSPLFNRCLATPGTEALLPALRQLQEQNVPIVILPQGQSQVMFLPPRGTKRLPGCDHQPPAAGHARNRDFTCPAFMVGNPRLDSHGAAFGKVLEHLRAAEIEPAAVFIDFESGVFLRNGAENRERLTAAMEEAWKCPRCLKMFGKEAMDTLAEYRAICARVRAEATRRTFTQPVADVFPEARTGNFFAWPIERYLAADGFVPAALADTGEDCYPAYGYEDSGMNVAQPRCYVVPGWRGWGKAEDVSRQQCADWNVFHYLVERFSRTARVLRTGELLVPWVGYLWRGDPETLRRQGRKIISPQAYAETVIHILLRGSETLAIFAPEAMTAEFPEGYPVDRADMGPMLRNIVDIQAGYNEVLKYDDFIRNATPLNLEIGGKPNQLDETAAVWSGVGNETGALIRTISFGRELTRTITLQGHTVAVAFTRTGKWWWIDPAGDVTLQLP